VMLQWCHRGLVMLFKWWYGGVEIVFHWCHSGVTEKGGSGPRHLPHLSHLCYSGVIVVSQWCHGSFYNCITVVLQWCYTVVGPPSVLRSSPSMLRGENLTGRPPSMAKETVVVSEQTVTVSESYGHGVRHQRLWCYYVLVYSSCSVTCLAGRCSTAGTPLQHHCNIAVTPL
jgi:hypothetical protein